MPLAIPRGGPIRAPLQGTKAGHILQFHVYFQKVMKTKEIHPDITLCTINSLPGPKKNNKKEKETSARAHTQPPPTPRRCFLRCAPTPPSQPLPRDPTGSQQVGPRPAAPKSPESSCVAGRPAGVESTVSLFSHTQTELPEVHSTEEDSRVSRAQPAPPDPDPTPQERGTSFVSKTFFFSPAGNSQPEAAPGK